MPLVPLALILSHVNLTTNATMCCNYTTHFYTILVYTTTFSYDIDNKRHYVFQYITIHTPLLTQ